MFRRRWSALPADPIFPSDMRQLGYFVNNVDEIRNINDPNNYFKFFITKNGRWNERQRFAMNQAIESLVHARLEKLGLQKTILPAGTPATSPHVPIFVSSNIAHADRIIVIFGESAQDMGIIAHRVIGGPGGVNKGSMVSVVQAIQEADTLSRAGIVIANPGQLWWWPEGKRGLTLSGRFAIPMQSAVHWGREYDARLNAIPGHETVGRHVKSVFEEVLGRTARSDAKLAVVAVTDVADEVERYLDDDENWKVWGERMESLALLGNYYGSTEGIKCEGFKTFLAERARAWIGDPDPLDVPIANPEGTPMRPGIGCPILSAGPEAYLAELLLIHAYPAILKWMREVAITENYGNPRYEIIESPPEPADARYWNGDVDKEVGAAAVDQATRANVQNTVASDEKTVLVEADQHHSDEYASVTGAVKEDATAVSKKPEADKEQGADKPGRNEEHAAANTNTDDINLPTSFRDDLKESSFMQGPNKPVPPPADDRPLRERIDDIAKMMDAQAKKAAALQKKEEEEKARLEHMRREVLHTLEHFEKMAAQTLKEGGKAVRDDSSDDGDDDDKDSSDEELEE